MITVILNAYRRPHALQLQINALLNQTVKPEQIWVWQNFHEDWDKVVENNNLEFTNIDRHIYSDYNWKYLGRFSVAMLAQTKYVAFFDDDTIPGPRWFENCLNSLRELGNHDHPIVLGGVGLIFNKDTEKYMNHIRVGWPSGNTENIEVDLIGHAWFLERSLLKYLWHEDPVTMETAEDMHLCYTLQKYCNAKFYIPPHPSNRKDLFSSLLGNELGIDHTTPSVVNQQNFFNLRNHCLCEYKNRGWKLVK